MDFFYFLHNNINKPILIFLNSFTNNESIKELIYIFSDAPIFILPIFLILYWIHFNIKKDISGKNKLLFIFYSTILAISISIFIQQFVDIDRPEESLKAVGKMILPHIPDNSFPSDHASVSISFLTSLFLFGFLRYFFLLTPFFVIMLLSRIIGGVHWPLDIVVGSFVGIFSSFIIYKSKNFNIFKKVNNFILKIASNFKL